VHLSVAPLATTPRATLDGTEQLPIPGVPMPDYLGRGDPVSWGIVDGTRIGYVYVRAWGGDAGVQFHSAVHTLLTQYETTGLIFDFRTNYGGNMFLAYDALELLFASEVSTVAFASRCSASDHFGMCPSPDGPPSVYVIHGTAAADYDRPIAVLVGPGAVSSGDQVAHLFKFHPRARFFGKSTSTAFNAPGTVPLNLSGWSSRFAA
jgi:C-terminal processing protease CtpA/Prc